MRKYPGVDLLLEMFVLPVCSGRLVASATVPVAVRRRGQVGRHLPVRLRGLGVDYHGRWAAYALSLGSRAQGLVFMV